MKYRIILGVVVISMLSLFIMINTAVVGKKDKLDVPKQSEITLLYEEGEEISGIIAYTITQRDADIEVSVAAIQIIENSEGLREWFQSGQVGEKPPNYIYKISGFNEDKMSLENFTNLWTRLNELNFLEQEDITEISGRISTIDGPAFLKIVFKDKRAEVIEKTIHARYFPIMLERSEDPSLRLFYTVFDAAKNTIEGYGRSATDIGQRAFLEDLLALKAGPSFEKPVAEAIEQLDLPILSFIEIKPETLNIAAKGVLTAHLEAPEGYALSDIDTGTLILEGARPLEVAIEEEKMVAKFSRADLVNIQPGEEVKFILRGELIDGTKFGGIDTIRVIQE